MNAYWFEIKRLLKNHKKTIVIGSILFAVLMTVLFPLLDSSENQVDELVVDVPERAFGEDSRPAYFQFYIEHEDGSVFTNFATLEEIFNNESLYSEIDKEIDIDLKQIKKDVRKQTPLVNFNPVTVTLNGSSNILTVLFDTGSNSNNLKAARHYNHMLFNDEFEFLNNNFLYEINAPQLIEGPELDVDKDETIQDEVSSKIPFSDTIKTGFTGLLLGLFLIVSFIFGKEFISRKLNYLFGYIKIESSDFAIYDSEFNKSNMISHYIGTPFGSEKIVLSEKLLSNHEQTILIGEQNNELSFEKNSSATELVNETTLTDINYDNNFTEIIITVVSGETSRKWYKQQINLSKLHHLPVKTIQINNK